MWNQILGLMRGCHFEVIVSSWILSISKLFLLDKASDRRLLTEAVQDSIAKPEGNKVLTTPILIG